MNLWQTVKTRYESLEVRERILITGATLAVMYLIWSLVAEAPMRRQQSALAERKYAAEQAIKSATAEIEVLQRVRGSRGENFEQQIALLSEKLNSLDSEIRSVNSGLISAKKIPLVLQQVVAALGEVELEQLHSLPVLPMRLTEAGVLPVSSLIQTDISLPELAANEPQGRVYRHEFELFLRGNVPDLLKFLTAVEALSTNIYWQSLIQREQRQEKNPPQLSMNVRLYLLTADETAAGVAAKRALEAEQHAGVTGEL